MPASTSSAEPTPSPMAKAASLTSWQTMRPATPPGASRSSHSTSSPIDGEQLLGLFAAGAAQLHQPRAGQQVVAGDRGVAAHGRRALARPAQPGGLGRLAHLRPGRRLAGGLGVLRAVPTLAVLVPAAAALPPQPPGIDHPLLERVGPPARLAEGQLGERLRHLEPDVDADQVHQLERTHAKAAAQAADAVDLLDRGHPLGQQPQRLGAERAPAAVDQEAGPVGGADHALAHRFGAALGGPQRARRRSARRRSPRRAASSTAG